MHVKRTAERNCPRPAAIEFCPTGTGPFVLREATHWQVLQSRRVLSLVWHRISVRMPTGLGSQNSVRATQNYALFFLLLRGPGARKARPARLNSLQRPLPHVQGKNAGDLDTRGCLSLRVPLFRAEGKSRGKPPFLRGPLKMARPPRESRRFPVLR